MMGKVRLNLEVTDDLADFLEKTAKEQGSTKADIVRRGLSVIKAYKAQKAIGKDRIGFSSDGQTLETELLGLLD